MTHSESWRDCTSTESGGREVLDKLAELNTEDPLFAGRLDLERIGVHGGSFGGMVFKTCADDLRVKCALLWDAKNIQSLCPAGLQSRSWWRWARAMLPQRRIPRS